MRPPQPARGEQQLRSALEAMADQLCQAVDGRLDFVVVAPVHDESLEKLALLINFVLDTARRSQHLLEQRNESLEELARLKSEFVANVSHELRTPLSLILGPARLLRQERDLDPESRRELDVILRNARSLLGQVNDLLDLSKLDAAKMKVEYARVDLAELVRLTAGQFDTLARELELGYRVECLPRLRAEVDPGQVQRIILNLLSNAFKFTPKRGIVRCTLRLQGSPAAGPAADEPARAVIEVADSGPGIPEQQREAVFDRFRQLEGGPARRFGGTGLGLPIARDLVRLHGGTISLSAAPEGGALFKVELPLRAPAGAQVRETARDGESLSTLFEIEAPPCLPSSEVTEAAELPERDAAPLVLVVEDHPEMRRFVARVLAGRHRVVTAADGEEGLRKARELQPDLVISDVMMPVVSGEALLQQLRADPCLAEIPVMLLTARADEEARVRLLREGASDYVTKPFQAEELLARAENLVTLRRARSVLQKELASSKRDLAGLATDLAERTRGLQHALETVEAARVQAEEGNRAKTRFLGLVSHELRTPLTAHNLQLELLQRECGHSTERQQRLLDKLASSSARLTNLIESLLEHARIESGRLKLDIAPVDVGRLVRETVEELRPLAEQKGLDLRLSLDEPLPEVRSDARLLRLVLVNLLMNAVKFTQTGGIEVVGWACSGECLMAVSDTGPGISLEDQERIFRPFEQLEPLAGKHAPGLGLGLAMVHEILDVLGGQIRLSSQVGHGSTFTVVLPLQEGPARLPDGPWPGRLEDHDEHPAGRG